MSEADHEAHHYYRDRCAWCAAKDTIWSEIGCQREQRSKYLDYCAKGMQNDKRDQVQRLTDFIEENCPDVERDLNSGPLLDGRDNSHSDPAADRPPAQPN